MDEARKIAYRSLLYRAMLDFRWHIVYPRDPNYWFKPWLWVRTRRRLADIQEVADWLHNIAEFAAGDFERFDETWFWRDTDRLLTRRPHLRRHVNTMYRGEFEKDWCEATKTWVKVRDFGSPNVVEKPIAVPAGQTGRT